MNDKLPNHIAIIMDGNGRWAKKRHLPRIMGHRAGINSVREIVTACAKIGIKILTLYVFSTENWSRPESEVNALMSLLKKYLNIEIAELKKNKVRLKAIGRLSALPESVQKELHRAINSTKNNTGLTLVLALNYGGRQEIVDAVNLVLEEGKENIDEKKFDDYLYTKGLPHPDLLIRTSGEMRISNFLLWQLAYTEIWVTNKLWPDFRKKDLLSAIDDYKKRKRRFGGLGQCL